MSHLRLDCDVVVVGGSLAGTAAAIALGKRGISTVVVEKATFPRRKGCGEGLSTAVLPLLDQLGVFKEFRALLPRELFGFNIYREHRLISSLRHAKPVVWGVPRTLLDTTLLRHAASGTSVRVCEGEKVNEIVEVKDGVRIHTTRGTVFGKYCIFATGAGDFSRQVSTLTFKPAKALRSGVSYLMQSRSNQEMVSIVARRGGELYLTPLPDGMINVSLLASGKVSDVWGSERTRAREIQKVLAILGIEAVQCTDAVGASSLGGRVLTPYSGKIVVTGDALRSFDPIGGMGMTHALATGTLAGEVTAKLVQGSISEADACNSYARLCKKIAAACNEMTSVSSGFVKKASRIPGISVASHYLGKRCHQFMESRLRAAIETTLTLRQPSSYRPFQSVQSSADRSHRESDAV